MKAVRTHTTRGAVITVELDDGTKLKPIGGKRAERAAAVLVGQWRPESPVEVLGCRADLHDAQVEAERRLSSRTVHIRRGGSYEAQAWVMSVAVPVVNEREAVDA